jgi:riboflavin biosynthesis pyrimidine reductase
VVVFVAPKILGGGKSWLSGAGPKLMADALPLDDVEVRRVGDDLVVSGVPVWPSGRGKSRSR